MHCLSWLAGGGSGGILAWPAVGLVHTALAADICFTSPLTPVSLSTSETTFKYSNYHRDHHLLLVLST